MDYAKIIKSLNILLWHLSFVTPHSISDFDFEWARVKDEFILISNLIAGVFKSIIMNEVVKGFDAQFASRIITSPAKDPDSMDANLWRFCCCDIIKSYTHSPRYSDEMIQWIHNSGLITQHVERFKESLQFSTPYFSCALLELIVAHLNTLDNDILLFEFEKAQGYELVAEFLSGLHVKDALNNALSSLLKITFMGCEDDDLMEGEMPFQHNGFEMPAFKRGIQQVIQNFFFKI